MKYEKIVRKIVLSQSIFFGIFSINAFAFLIKHETGLLILFFWLSSTVLFTCAPLLFFAEIKQPSKGRK